MMMMCNCISSLIYPTDMGNICDDIVNCIMEVCEN